MCPLLSSIDSDYLTDKKINSKLNFFDLFTKNLIHHQYLLGNFNTKKYNKKF